MNNDSLALSPYADEKGRLYYYDNAKFILIFFVVLAHAFSPFKESGGSGIVFMYLWRVINTLHMPCLIFISGFFAKKYIRPDGTINVQRPFTYILYYLAAQFTVAAFEMFVLKDDITLSVFSPRSSLWFLVCLIWWYCFLPLVDRVKPEVMFPIAVFLGLFLAYDSRLNGSMSISRVVTHYPFFLAGYYITPQMFEKIYSKKARIISIPVGIAALLSQLAITLLFKPYGDKITFSINSFITCDKPYATIFKNSSLTPFLWFVPRVWFYICAAMLCFAFLAWVPRKRYFFTKYGARTLAVYILHRYLYLAYLDYRWYEYLDNIPYLRLAIFPIALVITLVFSTYPFWYPFKLLGKIKIHKFLKTK